MAFADDPVGYASERALEPLPEHMREGAVRWVRHGLAGDFLFAVASGDLFEAAGRADTENAMALFAWVRWFQNYAPPASFGSLVHASAWRRAKGLAGVGKMR